MVHFKGFRIYDDPIDISRLLNGNIFITRIKPDLLYLSFEGVTDTPALRVIPEHKKMIETVIAHHPAGRMTTPEDVAQVLVALADPRITWISGVVIPVDGGEAVISIG